MRIIKFIAQALAVFVCVATLMPFIRTDKWYVRIFDFPRMQFFALGLIAMMLFIIVYRNNNRYGKLLMGLLVVALFLQAKAIIPYTPLLKEQVKAASGKPSELRVMVANVFQFNRNSHLLFDRIKEADPDVLLLTETDQWWADEMKELQGSHPHSVLQPQDNTYGMNLYSKLPLKDTEVRYLIDPAVPSIRTWLIMEDGRRILFNGVHPRPPGVSDPDKEEVQDSDQRDAELVVVAKEVVKVKGPVIVAGDFNDVAWSHTTRLFQRTAKLLDPRIGRGMYSTFHAKWPLLRYPLDHLFHSEHFTLMDIVRLDGIGSDHFPIMVALSLEPEAKKEQAPPASKEGDKQEAKEILQRVEE
jgi:endonuclease/exonuclease/phosphatase (EEP) superfamily protein YafD